MMIDFLKESLIFQHLLGVNDSFGFITGRVFNINVHKLQKTNVKKEVINSAKKEEKTINETENQLKITQDIKDKKDKVKNVNNRDDVSVKINTLKQDLIDINNFDELVEKIKNYDGCELKNGASNSVIFDGKHTSKIMLIGEAPGETEDIKGVPFCGQSGQLLRKVLSFANLSTDDNLFITNTVFWRPPMNRKPDKNEIQICLPFVYKMIDIIKPKLVILCGSTAINTFLENVNKVGDTVGKFADINFDLDDKKISVKSYSIYHPSFLLRNPIVKKTFWKHILMLKDFLLKNNF